MALAVWRTGLVLLAACSLLFTTPAQAVEVQGTARVVDGDTLEVTDAAGLVTKIRMYGIDAPESTQTCWDSSGSEYACGQVSKSMLAGKAGSAPVACRVQSVDRYGRSVAICSLVGGEELNRWQVSQGQAIAYRDAAGTLQYGGDQYLASENEAKAAKLGLWEGTFTIPALWRQSGNTPQSPSAASPTPPVSDPTLVPPNPDCPIKGNIASTGEKVYHVPGGSSYSVTKINVTAGEKWFCSETEAQVSGWRPAGCAIKGNISGSGKIYHLPGGRYYESTIIEVLKGERWFCSEAEAVAAGWRKSTY